MITTHYISLGVLGSDGSQPAPSLDTPTGRKIVLAPRMRLSTLMISRTTFSELKHPDEVLDYQVDFAGWLGTDTISQISATAKDVELIGDPTRSGGAVTLWLGGGRMSVARRAMVKVTAVTTAQRTLVCEAKLTIARLQ